MRTEDGHASQPANATREWQNCNETTNELPDKHTTVAQSVGVDISGTPNPLVPDAKHGQPPSRANAPAHDASVAQDSLHHLHLQTNIASSSMAAAPSLVPVPTNSSSSQMPTFAYEAANTIPDISNHYLTSPIAHQMISSSLRSNLSTSSLASSVGTTSNLPSPYLAALTDLTPLPSPVVGSDSPALWRRGQRPETPSGPGADSLDDHTPTGRLMTSPTSPTSPSRRKKTYGSLRQEVAIAHAATALENEKDKENLRSTSHTRNRSISDFVPDQLQNVRPRHVTFGPGDASSFEASEYHMQREHRLAEQRGLKAPGADVGKQLPTPPPSTSSTAESDDAEDELPCLEDGTVSEYLEIHCGIHNKRRKFRQLRQLGQGTFSTVMLATREKVPTHPTPEIEAHLDPHQLVAVKIVQHGPAGGADEERIEVGLRREVEMLKSVSHPSLIHLKACEYQDSRTLLVLSYCPGGDLFEFASEKRDLLKPQLIQRMFAELVSAVQYLHAHYIVHRDIKLENVLVNIPSTTLRSLTDPQGYPTPIVTLTDLGLSRRIPEPPAEPFLYTRCGSEDYAAPEILLGQPYDGRATDAWALGVLLYALMEGRLPFDAPPGKPDRSRNTHRIARCDWIWCRFGDEDGEWQEDSPVAVPFEGARPCVEGLLKKARMGRKPLAVVAQYPWVTEGITVPGGLRVREEDAEGGGGDLAVL